MGVGCLLDGTSVLLNGTCVLLVELVSSWWNLCPIGGAGPLGGACVLLVELVSYWWSLCPIGGTGVFLVELVSCRGLAVESFL